MLKHLIILYKQLDVITIKFVVEKIECYKK